MKKIRKYLHQGEHENLAKKLAAYSAAVSGAMVAGIPNAHAGVIFTPQVPDSVTIFQSGKNSSGYTANFDLDGDGIVDIALYYHSGVYGGATQYGAIIALPPTGNGIASYAYNVGGGGTYIALPYVINLGQTIGSAYEGILDSSKQYLGVVTNKQDTLGFWTDETSQFLGVYFLSSIDDSMHYGWIRLTSFVNSDTSLMTFIQGSAYESIPDKPIVAGYTGIADTVTNIVATDVGNNQKGTDLRVTFNKASYENTVSSYRVMVVPSTQAGSFTVVNAETVLPADYIELIPDSQNVSLFFNAGSTDVNGDTLNGKVQYNVFVLSMADSAYADSNALSSPSDTVILGIHASAAGNIAAADTGVNDNGTDLVVSFTKAASESTVKEYRIIVVPADSIFDLSLALEVPADRYTAVTPTGQNISQALSADALDVDSNLVQNNVPYQVYVLNVADGKNATVDTLSGPSNTITLIENADTAYNVTVQDTGNNDNGSDMLVSFDKARNEKSVGAYRIMVVKAGEATTFNLSDADTVHLGNYTSVSPIDSNIVKALSATATDVTGELIHDSITYQVFVLSVASASADSNRLSSPSAPITLGVAGIATVNELENVNVYAYASNLYIQFHDATKTNASLQVFNTIGQQVYYNLVNGNQKIGLNVTEGLYLVSVTQNGKMLRKLVYISGQ